MKTYKLKPIPKAICLSLAFVFYGCIEGAETLPQIITSALLCMLFITLPFTAYQPQKQRTKRIR